MWLTPNNVGKNSADPGRAKLLYFPADETATPASPAGTDPVTAGAVTLPGGAGTWTSLVAGGATTDAALAAAGRIEVQFRSTACRIPIVLNT